MFADVISTVRVCACVVPWNTVSEARVLATKVGIKQHLALGTFLFDAVPFDRASWTAVHSIP